MTSSINVNKGVISVLCNLTVWIQIHSGEDSKQNYLNSIINQHTIVCWSAYVCGLTYADTTYVSPLYYTILFTSQVMSCLVDAVGKVICKTGYCRNGNIYTFLLSRTCPALLELSSDTTLM